MGVIHDLWGIQNHRTTRNLDCPLYLDMVPPVIEHGPGDLGGEGLGGHLGAKPQVFILNQKGKTGGELPSIPMGIIGHGVLDGLGGYLEVSPLVIIENHKEMV